MMINSSTIELDPEPKILDYILVGSTISVTIICVFWIWYYVSSLYLNKCDASRVNKMETTNTTQRLSHLKSQRIKHSFFLSILSFELIRKSLALMEYFYVINYDPKYHMVEISSNDNREAECYHYETDLNAIAMKEPVLIVIRAVNLTSVLCLISLVGITMLYLTKMYKGERKLTSVKTLVIILALKAALVMILSSTIFLLVPGLIVWASSIVFDWLLIFIFAVQLIRTLNNSKRNKEMPLELKLTPNKQVIREYRVIACVTSLVVAFVFLYVAAQVVGVALDIADLAIIRTCYFWRLNIDLKYYSGKEISDYMDLREHIITCIYSVCLAFNFSIIISHFYFSIKNGRKIGAKLFCHQKQVLRYDLKKQELEVPLLNDNSLWTNETYVQKLDMPSCSI